MSIIQLTFELSDDLGLKSITFDYNDTKLPSSSETLGNIAIAILRAIEVNKDDLVIQDLLSELGIKKPD